LPPRGSAALPLPPGGHTTALVVVGGALVVVVEEEVVVGALVVLVEEEEVVGALVVLVEEEAHCPSALQILPGGQVPQVPWPPQPLGPHCLPVQFGAQHLFSPLHSGALGGQQTPLQQRVEQLPGTWHA
jgi:hypothetical protein